MLSNKEIDEIMNEPTRKCVVLVDIFESVRLIQTNEKAAIRQWLKTVDFAKSWLEDREGGNIVKGTGDGLLAEFLSEKQALAFSLALQAYVSAENAKTAEELRMFLRIGIENTNVFQGFRDIFGHGINIAARLADLAGPGEIVVSTSVRSKIDPGIDADVEDLGNCYLKHITEPVRAFRIHPVTTGTEQLLAPSATELRPTIAIVILPDPGDPVTGDILSEELGFVFSRSQHIRVISRLSARAVARPDIEINEIAELLGANFVIFGRIFSDGTNVAAPLALHSAKSGKVLWSDRFRFSAKNLIEETQATASEIAGLVGKTIIRHEVRKVSSMSLPTVESYGLLLAAIAGMYSLDKKEYDRAGDILEHLVYRERRHPLSHAWTANHYVLGASQGWLPDVKQATQKALAASGLALDIEPDNEIALTFDGLVHGNLLGQLDVAETRYREAIDTNPSASLAILQHGMLHAFRGEGAESVSLCERAQRLSPLDPHKFLYDSLTASCLFVDAQYERAVKMANRSLRANASHTSALRTLAMAQWEMGEHEPARETVRKLTFLDPKFSVSSWEENYPDKSSGQDKRFAKILRLAGAPD